MAPLRYLIVGSGYRAEYYGRIAMMYPELFRAMYLCRSEEKTARMTKNTGCPATVSREEALAFGPDFIVEAVDRSHGSDVSLEWAERGFPVMAETPVAASWAQWKAVRAAGERGARIVCLEQYHRYPILMAGIEAVRRGDIGQPLSCYLSLCHDYHAASLLRRMLGTAGESYVMHGIAQEHQAAETDSRCGAVLDGTMKPRQRDVVHIAYASGKTALYDFCPIQYRSYIRCRHVTVRGDRGEWSDCVVSGLDAHNQPVRQYLLPEIPARYRILDDQALRDVRRNWRSEIPMDTRQDEFAIASMLLDMGEYLRGGPSPYPLEEALDDAAFWLHLQEAVAHLFAPVGSGIPE